MKTKSKFFSIVSWFLLIVIFIPMQTVGAFYEPDIRVGRSGTWASAKSSSEQQQAAQSYPTDPTSSITWSGGTSGVADIQAAFNHARAVENSQLGISLPSITLPSQAEWNGMSDSEHALWLINSERIARGLLPLHGLESNVGGVAQYYADYLLDHNTWGHDADGRSPWDRLNDNPAIGACHDFLSVAENIFVFVTSGSSIPLPIERAVYG